MPLLDCAPLLVAREMGLFAAHGLDVALTAELGWATIRDKIAFGELDAAHAPAGMVVATTLGLRTPPVPCITGFVINLNGNAITLSHALWKRGVRDGHSLRRHIRTTGERPTFGVVHKWSTHNVLLREWLRSYGLQPDEDAHMVVIPPSQLFDSLRNGHLDGFCVGEPWNSLAVLRGAGSIVAYSSDLAPDHTEKVIMVRADFDVRKHDEHMALLSALDDACAFCGNAANHPAVVEILHRSHPQTLPSDALHRALGTQRGGPPSMIRFSGGGMNVPTPERVAWILGGLRREGLIPYPAPESLDLAARCFRADLLPRACAQPKSASNSHENHANA